MAIVPLKEEAEIERAALLRRLIGVLEEISRDEGISKGDVLALLQKDELTIPLSIFTHSELGILELVVKYLKEHSNLSLSDIARLLHRDKRTVWTTYHFAARKLPGRLAIHKGQQVPVSALARRDLGILESLAVYLKDERGMRYSQIAQVLHRNDRTIWTVYNRAKKKHAN